MDVHRYRPSRPFSIVVAFTLAAALSRLFATARRQNRSPSSSCPDRDCTRSECAVVSDPDAGRRDRSVQTLT